MPSSIVVGNGRKLILASTSARRRELLESVGITPSRITPPDIDESIHRRESARHYVARMAQEKAEHVARMAQGKAEHEKAEHGADDAFFILAADTIAVRGRRILDRPVDEAQAAVFLELLSGRRHIIMSGICLLAPDGQSHQRRVETAVQFKRLNSREITTYIASGEWKNKAGGYAAQGMAGAFIQRVNGSWSNVLGLPLYETLALLSGTGALGS